MVVYVLRAGSNDPGAAFGTLREAAAAAANMNSGEIVRVTLRGRGAALHCALFNRELGDDARTVALVQEGVVVPLHPRLALQTWACPHGCVQGVLAPAGTQVKCAACDAPLTPG